VTPAEGMTITPHTPLTTFAVAYVWRQLAQRIGLVGRDALNTGFEELGIPVHYARPDQVQLDRPGIIVTPCSDAAWLALLERAPHSLDHAPLDEVLPGGGKAPFDSPVPVLFWGEGCQGGNKPFVEQREDGSLIFYTDIIAAVFFMLSRWEETVTPTRDEHKRFPATASVAYRQDFLDRPIVDEYALILREWLKALLPGWEPKRRAFGVKLSHDIDRLRWFPHWREAARTFGGDLLKRHSPRLAWQTALRATFPSRDPFFQGVDFLAGLSHEHGLGNDAFYFMAAEPGPMENKYKLNSPLLRRCIDGLRQRGFEIGLHPGYGTFNNPEQLAAEKARLDAVLGETHYGGRQHYLRFQVPDTWRHWEQVGLAYDSTLAFADHEGFRCGTCHPFRPFDVQENRELNLWEHPLIVMDRTLLNYRGLAPAQAVERVLQLARRCKSVEGDLILLWHNSLLARLPLEVETYKQIVSQVTQMK